MNYCVSQSLSLKDCGVSLSPLHGLLPLEGGKKGMGRRTTGQGNTRGDGKREKEFSESRVRVTGSLTRGLSRRTRWISCRLSSQKTFPSRPIGSVTVPSS